MNKGKIQMYLFKAICEEHQDDKDGIFINRNPLDIVMS